ncbi:unnamed protein product [Amaranthus hypochondriacus]
MMLSRISRSISRSSRASLLNAVTGCDGYSARIASQSGMFASRANPELGFFHSYFSSIGAAKHAAPSFSSFSSSNFVNPSISRFFSTDTSNKQSKNSSSSTFSVFFSLCASCVLLQYSVYFCLFVC